MGNARFKDKVVIVTGAAGGMGRAEVEAFAREGATVVATDIRADSVDGLDAPGEGIGFVAHDIASEAGWRQLVDETMDRHGRIDVLVNNAAYLKDAALLDLDVESLRRHFDINLIGSFLGMRTVVPAMIAGGGGVIINITSISGMIGHPSRGAYAASKWALRGLSATAALEWAPHNIRVCSVVPGPIDTPLSRVSRGRSSDQSLADTPLPDLPMGRFGRPDEIARAVLFLASDEGSFITGSELVVDGGCLLNR